MIQAPPVDGRRFERLFEELRGMAPHYVPEMSVSGGAGVALMRIFAQLAELVAVRLDRAPDKHFVAFLDRLGILPLPARPARAAVAFRLAADLQTPIAIPAGTRVTAPGPDDEIPFETTGPLVAVPGGLGALYGADPTEDCIFRPPPGFLRQEPHASTALEYVVQAFAAAGTDRLQLDHLTELEPGAFVRVACFEKHVIRALDDGNIVVLEQPLARDISDGAFVTPIRNFEVFNGIDVQEHVLYIGHSGALTVKEPAEIRLTINLQHPSATPLDIAWQFWTKDEEAVPEQEEHWADLTVQADGTQGLMGSGDLVLLKLGTLEVKAREVAATGSRWIRGRLRDKLKGPIRSLPRIESMAISVGTRATGGGIFADQGFYNAAPLDVRVDKAVGFLPFGPEPRAFDQFYLASKEAFTKKDATVTLHFTMDLQALASPALALVPTSAGNEMRGYSIGLRRRLFELRTNGSGVTPLGDPSTTPIAGRAEGSRFFPVDESVPSAVAGAGNDEVAVFVIGADSRRELPSRLWMHRPDAAKPWVDLDGPDDGAGGKKALQFSPMAVRLPSGAGFARVFVVDSEGKLHSRRVENLVPALDAWQSHGSPPQVELKSSPFVVLDDATKAPRVFVTGILTASTGPTAVVCQFTTSTAVWDIFEPADDFEPFSRPFAQPFTRGSASGARVFVVGFIDGIAGKTWQLRECDTLVLSGSQWDNLGLPTTPGQSGFDNEFLKGRPDDCAPSGFVEDPSVTGPARGKHIFLRAPDDRLYERLDGANDWRPRQFPGNPGIVGSPAALPVAQGTDITALQVFAASNRNSLARRHFQLIRGTGPASPEDQVALLGAGSPPVTTESYDGTLVQVTHSDGSVEILEIEASDTSAALVRAKTAFTRVPAATSTIRILKMTRAGQAPAGSPVRLPSEASDIVDKVLVIGGVPRLVTAFDAATHEATFDPALASLPALTEYDVYEHTHEAPGRAGADRALVMRPKDTGGPALPAEYVRLQGVAALVTGTEFSIRSGVLLFPTAPPAVNGKQFTIAMLIESASTEFKGVEELDVLPELSWEYWNGRGWLSLKVKKDSTRNLLSNGEVVFDIPRSLEPTEVAGQENFWIRARLVGGDYGHETFTVDQKTGKVTSDKSSLRPPKVSLLLISYKAKPQAPEACITFNNLAYVDQTGAAQLNGAHFAPFERLEDPLPTLFLGFERPFKSGPVRLLFDVAEREIDPANPPNYAWRFRRDHEWRDLQAEDGSMALTQQGILLLSAPEELTRDTLFGESLFWVKGTLRERPGATLAEYPRPLMRGVFTNTVWATQGETITEEIVGSSTGDAGQTLQLQHGGILENEDIRVREALSVEEQQRLQQEQGEDAVVVREDIGGTWVQWRETRAFFDASPDDRSYRIDRAAGILQFGDDVHGRIPPAGIDNIRAFTYRTGGGSTGNLNAGAINTLGTSIEGVEAVFNPTPTGGGSDKADTTAMLRIGPRQISHGDRAVSPEDFENLAYEASQQVAKARCLAATNLGRAGAGRPDPCDPAQRHVARREQGYVSLIVVPHSTDPRPCPSLALRRTVAEFLRERAPSLLVAGNRLIIRPPDYVIVDLTMTVFVLSLERAAEVEKQAVEVLATFLHPLQGGPESEGWDFGRSLSKSDVFAVLERMPNVDRVEELSFNARGTDHADGVPVGPNELLAGGTITVRVERA